VSEVPKNKKWLSGIWHRLTT